MMMDDDDDSDGDDGDDDEEEEDERMFYSCFTLFYNNVAYKTKQATCQFFKRILISRHLSSLHASGLQQSFCSIMIVKLTAFA